MPGKRGKTKKVVANLRQIEVLHVRLRAGLQPLLLHSAIR
jgi:hypothetical protein